MEIYKELTAMLDYLYNQTMSSPLTPTVPSKPGTQNHNSSSVNTAPAKEMVITL